MAVDRLTNRTDGCHILLVEDNDSLRSLMRLALEHEGYSIDEAPTAEEGLRLMENHRYDLVLTDYSLPGRTGAWLLHEADARDLLRGAATLVVTAESSVPTITGEPGVVAKPIDLDVFLPQVRAILGAGLELAAARALAGAHVRAQPTKVELVLYVSRHSTACTRAERALRRLFEDYDMRWIDFEVRDVAAMPDAAADDRIVYTPTLLKRSPPPGVWIVGELSSQEKIADLLRVSGVPPSHT
jgi:DNA-binding response OmpR family regulator